MVFCINMEGHNKQITEILLFEVLEQLERILEDKSLKIIVYMDCLDMNSGNHLQVFENVHYSLEKFLEGNSTIRFDHERDWFRKYLRNFLLYQ